MENNASSLHLPVTTATVPQDSYYYTPSGQGNTTISPQNLQYSIPPSQSPSISIPQHSYQRTPTGSQNRASPYNYQMGQQQNPQEYFVDPRNSVQPPAGGFSYSPTPPHNDQQPAGPQIVSAKSVENNATNSSYSEQKQYGAGSQSFANTLAAYASPKLVQAATKEAKDSPKSVPISFVPPVEQNRSPAPKKITPITPITPTTHSEPASQTPRPVEPKKSEKPAGLRTIHPELLETTTKSSIPRLPYARFLAFSDEPIIYNDLKSQ